MLIIPNLIAVSLQLSTIKNTHNWHVKSVNQHTIWADNVVAQEVNENWFSPHYWLDSESVIGESKGRYTTFFVEHTPQQIKENQSSTIKMVLRHYYRGGLISKISLDRFLCSSVENTRAFKELNMLKTMRDLGLPVPNPIACMVTKVSWFKCVNDILIELIDDAKDGFQLLMKQSFKPSQWQALGSVIKRFHDHGVYHSDLNIHNVMLDKNGQFWLIDFDRCDFREVDERWQQSNLDRLKRSLEKEKSLHAEFQFTEHDWQHVLSGYHN